ncbi:MAG: hypothetical protein U9N84_04415 [Actinomycetota bacterium]|nr:hypothetical protein [Actinomycetota bacterium]
MTRRGTLLLAGALLATACSGTTADPTTTTTPPTTAAIATTTVAPTTTSIAPTTTTKPPITTTTVDPLARPDVLVSNVNRESVDDFDTTGDDLYRVVMELRDLFVYLEGSPTGSADEMLSLMFEPDYPFWDPIMAGFLELTENAGWHYIDPGVETLGIELVEVDGDRAVFRLAGKRGVQVIADDTGNTVKTYDGWDREVPTITYKRGSDGRWRYADLESSVPISDEELATMVPIDWTGRTP